MKKSILVLALTGFMAGTLLTGCQSSNQKVENAKDKLQDAKANVIEAKQDLNEALKDSIQQFKNESEGKISYNEKIIAEFKAKIAKGTKVTKANYEKMVAELEQKNRYMKKKLDEFNGNEQDKWDSFKREFNHDMDELGKSLKDLTVNNTK